MDNSPSASTSASSTPPDTPAEAAAPVTNDGRAKRFDYLLKQTEVFSHFMGGSGKAKSPLKMKPEKKKKPGKNAKEGDHRHRMTEQEEDEELLTDLNNAKKNVISFDESPSYIKVNISFFNIFTKLLNKQTQIMFLEWQTSRLPNSWS